MQLRFPTAEQNVPQGIYLAGPTKVAAMLSPAECGSTLSSVWKWPIEPYCQIGQACLNSLKFGSSWPWKRQRVIGIPGFQPSFTEIEKQTRLDLGSPQDLIGGQSASPPSLAIGSGGLRPSAGSKRPASDLHRVGKGKQESERSRGRRSPPAADRGLTETSRTSLMGATSCQRGIGNISRALIQLNVFTCCCTAMSFIK